MEFVRKQRTNYARRIVQPFQTRTKPPQFAFESLSKRLFDKLNRAALPKKSGAAAYFSMNRTPRVPGPQWLETVQPARVTQISSNG